MTACFNVSYICKFLELVRLLLCIVNIYKKWFGLTIYICLIFLKRNLKNLESILFLDSTFINHYIPILYIYNVSNI